MNRVQAKRAMKTHDLIGTSWRYDHTPVHAIPCLAELLEAITSREGYGLTAKEAMYLCDAESYGGGVVYIEHGDRARVRGRIRELVRKYHSDLAKSGQPMRYRKATGCAT